MKAPEKTHLRIGEVPKALVLAGTAVAGTKPLCWPTRTCTDLARGSMLTYESTCNAGQWLEDQRRSEATSPRRRATYGGDDNISVSHSAKEEIEVATEHQRLTKDLA